MVEKTDGNRRSINRRGYLGAIAGLTAASVVGSAVGAADSNHIDSDAGSIESELEDAVEGGGEVTFDGSGTYRIDGTVRVTGEESLTLNGNGATLEVGPTDDYVCKLGTYSDPIGDLTVKNFTADISADGAGGRVFECQGDSSLEVSDITIEGEHDTPSKGPMLVGLQSSGGSGTVSNVSMPDGGADVSGGNGGTGMLVSNYHSGHVTIEDCHIGPFPDNGIYCSSDEGEVHVEGGLFENVNVAGVRLDGDDCSITGSKFVYDENIEGFGGQRPIRCDGGSSEISDVDIEMSIDQTEAVRVMSGSGSVSIEGCSMDLDGVRDAISVVSGGGPVTTSDNDIEGEERQEVYHY